MPLGEFSRSLEEPWHEPAISAHDHQRVFELHPRPMWVFDLETLQILDVNRAAVYHYGYSRAEFLCLTLRELRPREDVRHLEDYLPTTRDNPHPATTLWRHLKKDGSIIDVEISSFKVDFGTRPAKLVLIHDVTEHRRTERTMGALLDAVATFREERLQLEHCMAETLSALGELARSEALDDARVLAEALVMRVASMLQNPLAEDVPPASETRDTLPALSAREREVLERVAEGHTNRAVAEELGLSIKSVEAYRARFMGKLGLRSRADVVRYSLECGLLRPSKRPR
jgi:PAS domain S-box-containing protein